MPPFSPQARRGTDLRWYGFAQAGLRRNPENRGSSSCAHAAASTGLETKIIRAKTERRTIRRFFMGDPFALLDKDGYRKRRVIVPCQNRWGRRYFCAKIKGCISRTCFGKRQGGTRKAADVLAFVETTKAVQSQTGIPRFDV